METDFFLSANCLSATWIPIVDDNEIGYTKDLDEFIDPFLEEERAYGEV
jgi:hypothetical protein